MDGILNINKPAGKTSFAVVAMIKKLSGERRVGHAGTLDPMATGVLPVCLGQGTRIVEFLADFPKTYQAQIELGITTDTYDAAGKIVETKDPSGISQAQVESALATFSGTIEQTPPMYSAIKHKGRPLYELARAGISIERKNRTVMIYRLDMADWQPPVVTIDVECSKGTYIRSLAHDLGQRLGCGASLKSLARLSYGPFDISTALTMPQLETAFRYGYWQCFVYPTDSVLLPWCALLVGNAAESAIRNGAAVPLKTDFTSPKESLPQKYCRAYTLDGNFLGVLHFDSEKGQWLPEKVFH